MTHVTCRLTAKNRSRLRNPTLGNRVWATFLAHRLCVSACLCRVMRQTVCTLSNTEKCASLPRRRCDKSAGLPWIWISTDICIHIHLYLCVDVRLRLYPWICMDFHLYPCVHIRLRLYYGYIHGYAWIYPCVDVCT